MSRWQVLVCGVLLLLAESCTGQQCSPANNSDGIIIPNSDLPSEGILMQLSLTGCHKTVTVTIN